MKAISAGIECILFICEAVLSLHLKIRARMSVIFGYAYAQRLNAVHSATVSAYHTVLDSKWSSLNISIINECLEYRGAHFNPEKSMHHVAPNYLNDDARASRDDSRESTPCIRAAAQSAIR